MTGSGSPCGACKFLRRKCMRGCVFAPYFCHEQGATHFAAIHKVFGASNVSKLLAHLPVSDRSEAAVTISYEAQARLQDPIYGCVSHIFSLQQQVVSLQTQLASLKEQAARTLINGSIGVNPNERLCGKFPYNPQDLQGWLQSEISNMIPPRFDPNMSDNFGNMTQGEMIMNLNNMGNHYRNPSLGQEHMNSFASFEEGSHSMDSFQQGMETSDRQLRFQDHADELQSIPFGYVHPH
ncbi:LOB domain-containing protein 14-like [Impatiens glandulifera]|uniref:LOB domain-containing protein 14-like n=1 Tax=Impatiens glandulifera TaxID=253017 RepID=UPI001FB06D7D|nr:LOB domain-containing protein 14-like [Impatiens glandulifera]